LTASSGGTDESEPTPPGKLDVRTGPSLPDILIFSILLPFNKLTFLRFSGLRLFLASLDLHDIRINYHFLTFFPSVSAPHGSQWAPFQLSFAPWLTPLVMAPTASNRRPSTPYSRNTPQSFVR